MLFRSNLAEMAAQFVAQVGGDRIAAHERSVGDRAQMRLDAQQGRLIERGVEHPRVGQQRCLNGVLCCPIVVEAAEEGGYKAVQATAARASAIEHHADVHEPLEGAGKQRRVWPGRQRGAEQRTRDRLTGCEPRGAQQELAGERVDHAARIEPRQTEGDDLLSRLW